MADIVDSLLNHTVKPVSNISLDTLVNKSAQTYKENYSCSLECKWKADRIPYKETTYVLFNIISMAVFFFSRLHLW